jgi:hypothetical protein
MDFKRDSEDRMKRKWERNWKGDGGKKGNGKR